MTIRILAAFAVCTLMSATVFARDVTVLRTDTDNWPLVRVVVQLPGEDSTAADYTMTVPETGKTVPAIALKDLTVRETPVNMVVAVDTSRSLSPERLGAAKDALSRYVGTLNKDEQVALLGFNDTVQLASGFTTDRDVFTSSLGKLELAGNRTELYRAMLYGVEMLKDVTGDRALLVVTDGKDEGSPVTRNQVLEAARDNGVRISSIGLPGLAGTESATYLPRLKAFAGETGGLYREADTAAELGNAVHALLVANRDMATHIYELSFDLSGAKGLAPGEHKAEVRHKWQGTPQTAAISLAVPAPSATPQVQQVAAQSGGTSSSAMAATVPSAEPERSFLETYWPMVLALLLLALWILYRWRGVRRALRASAAVGTAAAGETLVLEFPDLGRSIPLRPGNMIMGSGLRTDVRVDAPDVADIHAEFCSGEECQIRPMDGTRGVLLNGERITGLTKLHPGDELLFGSVRAVVRDPSEGRFCAMKAWS